MTSVDKPLGEDVPRNNDPACKILGPGSGFGHNICQFIARDTLVTWDITVLVRLRTHLSPEDVDGTHDVRYALKPVRVLA